MQPIHYLHIYCFGTLSYQKREIESIPGVPAPAAESPAASRSRTQCAIGFWTGNRCLKFKVNSTSELFFYNTFI